MTVTDDEAPLLVCPADISLTAASGSCDAVATWTHPVPTDNCTASGSITLTSTHASGSTFALGTTTVTYTATDAAGNVSTCSFTVTVTDTSAPTFTAGCGALFTANTVNGVCYGDVTVVPPTATDNCGVVSLINDYTGAPLASGFYPVGTTIVVWTATDASGNTTTCSQTVTVTDVQVPTINCPTSIVTSNAAGLCTALVTIPVPYTADNCGVASVLNSFNGTSNASDTYPVGTTTVLWTVTDVNGNTATGSHTVTVTDDEAPLLVCPADISLTAASGSCDAVATWTAPVPTDNCTASGSITLTSTHASGSTFALGTTTVTYTATDAGATWVPALSR
ncbi:MAG: HYR domain-containing protein [Sphingobacteriales bacterium]|nr:HYR domain-containing protein [Sphingobacteriales bacterium]